MSFKNVLGQKHVEEIFCEILKKGYLAHAYIFLGIDGVGKALFARQLAKSLNCIVKGVDSCDKCASCRRVDAETSPDTIWISLEKGKKFIGIKDIKGLQDVVALKPVESNYKIFIIQDANKLTEEAFNCLLKTLEEPPPSSLFVLLSNSLDSLPETIVSRCQIIKFNNLPKEIIHAILQDRYNDSIGSLEWYIQISNGSIGNAISLIEEDLHEKNKSLIESLKDLTITDNFTLSRQIHDWVPSNKKTFEEKRWYLKIILDFMLYYYRDILVGKTKPFGNGHYINSEHIDLIENQSILFSYEEIMRIIDQIYVAHNELESNANTNFLFENLLANIASVTES